MKTSIKKTDPSQITKLAKMHASIFAEIGETAKSGREMLGEDRKNRCALVAETGSDPVGYAVVYGGSETAYFAWLGVSPKARRKNAGTLLLKGVEAWSRKNKSKTVMLDTRNRYASAICFYLKNDYKIVGTWIGTDGDTMIRLRKKL